MFCYGVCWFKHCLGGVGGGLIADWLSVVGGRYWLTAGQHVTKTEK
jgi:hypothetical protein